LKSRQPPISLEMALDKAKGYVKRQPIPVKDAYIESIVLEQSPGSNSGSCWRVTWQNKQWLKGGQTFVFVCMDGSIWHGLGE
jgi:hypothetical protein